MPTPEELLKMHINDAPNRPVSLFSDQNWSEAREEMVKHFEEDDISTFLSWPVVRRTMFFKLQSFAPFRYIREQTTGWSKWTKAMKESSVGGPEKDPISKRTSENVIHQARHLARLVEKTSCKIEELDEVVEIGGGYGCLCRLIFRLGFKGRYILYDLPEFSYLQEYYLSQIDIKPKPKLFFNQTTTEQNCIVILNDFSLLQKQMKMNEVKNNLLVGMWSISEMPIPSRNKLFASCITKNPRYYLFGYVAGYKLQGLATPENCLDNTAYFEKFKNDRLKNHVWTDWRVDYLRGENFYTIGEFDPINFSKMGIVLTAEEREAAEQISKKEREARLKVQEKAMEH